MTLSPIEANYVMAFNRCYPQKNIVLKPKRVSAGHWATRVFIDGDGGDILLTHEDMQFATELLNRGIHSG